MKEQDYELLSQYLDGELRGSAAQALRERLMAEPPLRAELERLQMINNRISEAFDFPGADAVPNHISKLLEEPARQAAPQRRKTWGFAVAASLVAATGLLMMPDQGDTPNPQVPSDQLIAHLLEQAPSRGEGWEALNNGSQFRPLLSFQNKSGDWCREYQLSSAGETWRGVACREQNAWGTTVIAQEAFIEPGSEYRPAGAANPDDIAVFINTNAADIPLSLEQEAQLISSNWQ